jgi:hypothetical protein
MRTFGKRRYPQRQQYPLKRWLGPEHRCLVPFTSFSEYDTIDGKKVPVWFASDESRPLLAFAGLWTNWTSVRKAKEGEIITDIFAFLTCEPNVEVARVHPKAMPVSWRQRKSTTSGCAPRGTRQGRCSVRSRTARCGSSQRARRKTRHWPAERSNLAADCCQIGIRAET